MVLDLAIDAGIATLTLNRPQALNGLDRGLIAALPAATRLERGAAVRTVVIRGACDQAAFAECAMLADFDERLAAFFGKRPPRFD